MTIRDFAICPVWMPSAVMVLILVAGRVSSQELGWAKPGDTAHAQRIRADESHVRALIEQLGAPTFKQREQAETKLRALSEKALFALDDAANSDDPEIRVRSLALAKEIRVRPAPPPLKLDLNARPIVEKHGELKKDERWSAANTYLVSDHLVVRNGTTLTLEPGTFVVVAQDKDINVHAHGSLIAKSDDKDNPVVIASLSEAKGEDANWGNLLVHGNIDLQNVQIRRSKGVVIRFARGATLPLANIDRPTSGVVGLSVYHTDGDAIVLERPIKTFRDIAVGEARGVGIGIRGFGSNIRGISVSGARIGMQNEAATSEIADATIRGCETGLIVANKGTLRCSDLNVSHCSKIGIHVNHGLIRAGQRCTVKAIDGIGLHSENRSSVNIEAVKLLECVRPIVEGPDR